MRLIDDVLAEAIKKRDDAEKALKAMGFEIFHMPPRPIGFYEVKSAEEAPRYRNGTAQAQAHEAPAPVRPSPSPEPEETLDRQLIRRRLQPVAVLHRDTTPEKQD